MEIFIKYNLFKLFNLLFLLSYELKKLKKDIYIKIILIIIRFFVKMKNLTTFIAFS